MLEPPRELYEMWDGRGVDEERYLCWRPCPYEVQHYLIEGADSAGRVVWEREGYSDFPPLPATDECLNHEGQTMISAEQFETWTVVQVRVTAIAKSGEKSPPSEWLTLN